VTVNELIFAGSKEVFRNSTGAEGQSGDYAETVIAAFLP
jgi:hypothetical protein